jgi:hypothetical protein
VEVGGGAIGDHALRRGTCGNGQRQEKAQQSVCTPKD